MLIDRAVGDFIGREGLLSPRQAVVAAVSGGADSLCLLDCLQRLGYACRVAHLDHGLRRGSWREAEFVLGMARARGLPAIVERREPAQWRDRGRSLEEAARLVRYRFLVRAARQWGASVIATGHTADDQAETILMHFLRGAGGHGLRGMLPRTPLDSWAGLTDAEGMVLVRPLLTTRRAQTEAHCRSAGLRPRRDASNNNPAFFRNRLRHRLLPELETYNPRLRQILARTGEVMRRETEVLDEILDNIEAGVVQPAGPGRLAFRREAFRVQPLALRRALVGRVAQRLAPGLRDFGFDAVELACARLSERRVQRRTALPGGLELLDQGDVVLMLAGGAAPEFPDCPQLRSLDPAQLRPPDRVLLQVGELIASTSRRPPDLGRKPPDGLAAGVWLDRTRLASHLVVRPPRAGDRMQPLGMHGHRKLADIFNSLHIPAGARPRWPVVTSDDEIVWLAGLRLSETARLTPTTRSVVHLRVDLGEGGPA